MAWTDELVLKLRIMIDDDCSEPSYDDTRLSRLILLAAEYVQQEIYFAQAYTISVPELSISPDPSTATSDESNIFINFVILKAACMVDWSTFRQKALIAGVKARCGPAVLETMQHLDGFKTLLDKGPCAAYEELKKDYQFGNTNVVRAILSPFVGNNFDPRTLSASRTDRGRGIY